VSPPVAPGQYDTPTPPQGYAPPPQYDVPPVADPLPPAPPVPPRDTDPWTAPADPAGRHASGTVGEYVDELGGTGTRRDTDPDAPLGERYDEPYRPGGEGTR
jgi:hypothetical protein